MTVHQQIKERFAQNEVGAKMEVVNTFGRADVVTSSEVIEVSNISSYKEAFGRVLAYTGSPTFAGLGLTPRLHLFCGELITQHNFEKIILQVLGLCKGRVRVTFGNIGSFRECEIPVNVATTTTPIAATPPVVLVPQMQRQPFQSVSKKFDRFKK